MCVERCLHRHVFGSQSRGRLIRGTAQARNARRQHTTVTNASQANKGFNILEWAGPLVPQGMLVKGAKAGWRSAWQVMMRELAPQDEEGGYKRPSYAFDGRIGDPAFPVESGRYHVYVGNACPWCHRVLMALVLRGMLQHVSFTWLADDAERASRGGWVFNEPDPVFGARDLREVYDACQRGFTGRCTAPLLVDRRRRVAVCNEGAMIVRMLNEVSMQGCTDVQLRPPHLAADIDALNDVIYNDVNNGVYKSGFATTQVAYERAQSRLYKALDMLDARLQQNRFLLGDKFCESDLWLYPTLIRYDTAYATLFKCSRKRIRDYANLSRWLADVYNITIAGSSMQIKDTFDLDDARRSYFEQLFPLNPGGIVPVGPTLDDLGLTAAGAPSDVDALFHKREQPVAA